jgi:two-component system, NtrC family, response regulator AtoC
MGQVEGRLMAELTETLRDLTLTEVPGRLRATVFRGSAFEVHPLPQAGQVTVGRGQVADIVIDHASISRVHAILTLNEDGSIEVQDAGSSNGRNLT